MPLVSKTFSQIITFTRASSATYFDAAGVLQTATTDVPRFDYDPSTLAALGFLIEESRTNSIRNNTMQSAVAGTPGTLPTNWTRSASPTSGISSEIVGTGTETGITYIDIRFSGTCTGAFSFSIIFETSSGVAASPSQTWTSSAFVKLQAGSLNGSTFQYVLNEYNSVPAFLRNTFSSVITPTTAGLATQRTSATVTTGASTAFVQPIIAPAFANGLTYDFTLRIGLPQLEQGAFATSVIPTTTTAVTRAADVASVNTLSPWFNAVEGTLYAEVSAATGFNVTGTFGRYAGIQDALNNNSIEIFWDGTANLAPRYRVRSGGANQAIGSSVTSYTANTVLKSALGYQVDSFAGVSRGAVDLTDTSGAVPVNQTFLSLGSEGGSVNFLNGHLRRIVYYPRRLANAELQSITS